MAKSFRQRCINSLTTIVYNLAKERFGLIKPREQPQPIWQPKRREREMHCLRKEIKAHNKLFKTRSLTEKEGITNLTSKLIEQMCKLCREEYLQQQRKDEREEASIVCKRPLWIHKDSPWPAQVRHFYQLERRIPSRVPSRSSQ